MTSGGPIAASARHPVFPKILMMVLLIVGFVCLRQMPHQVLPDVQKDLLSIEIEVPGSSAEYANSVAQSVERTLDDVEGVDEITSLATNGRVQMLVKTKVHEDVAQVQTRVEERLGRLALPDGTNTPRVSVQEVHEALLTILVFSTSPTRVLDAAASRVAEGVDRVPGVRAVEVSEDRSRLALEVASDTILALQRPWKALGAELRQTFTQIPLGTLSTAAGPMIVQIPAEGLEPTSLSQVKIAASDPAAQATVADLGRLRPYNAAGGERAFYNGRRAAILTVHTDGGADVPAVASSIRAAVLEAAQGLPTDVSTVIVNDRSLALKARTEMLLMNLATGFVVVFAILWVFLGIRLAFWISLGILVAFLGAAIPLNALGSTVNMFSLYAAIVTVGIVVDDAIVVGESVLRRRQKSGVNSLDASVRGTRDVAVPVTFAALTTTVAFLPILFLPGAPGRLFRDIPLVIAAILLISLVESLLILPSHLARSDIAARRSDRLVRAGGALQKRCNKAISLALRYPIVTVTIWAAAVVLILASVWVGHSRFIFAPPIAADRAVATGVLLGSTEAEQHAVHESLIIAATAALHEVGGNPEDYHVFSTIGTNALSTSLTGSSARFDGQRLVSVQIEPRDPDHVKFPIADFTEAWQRLTGAMSARRLDFQWTVGTNTKEIIVELRHEDPETLARAARRTADGLAEIPGVDIKDLGLARRTSVIEVSARADASTCGSLSREISPQITAALHGIHIGGFHVGSDWSQVYLRAPQDALQASEGLAGLPVLSSTCGAALLRDLAIVSEHSDDAAVRSRSGTRFTEVSAEIADDREMDLTRKKIEELFPSLRAEFPGLFVKIGGSKAIEDEVLSALGKGYVVALFAIFALLALPLRSFASPVIIMCAIPGGIAGAVMGHLLLGMNLSIVSMMGIVALSGVVVNEALVLIHRLNEAAVAREEISAAVTERLRPIILTSLTTALGMAPMALETAAQARILVPMAVSLGAGVLWTALTTPFIIPALWVLIHGRKVKNET